MSARLDRRSWMVSSADLWEAQGFVELLHRSRSSSNTATYLHGLYRAALVPLAPLEGVAWWIPPTRRAATAVAGEDGWRGVLCLSRLVLAPEVPRNGASFLLASSRRLIDRARWPVLLTYADTALGHTGAIYRADNWACEGARIAGDNWVNALGQRRGIKRGNRTRTVAEMEAAGFTRAAKQPKIRFVHRVAS